MDELGLEFRLGDEGLEKDQRKISAEFDRFLAELSRRKVEINPRFRVAKEDVDRLVSQAQGAGQARRTGESLLNKFVTGEAISRTVGGVGKIVSASADLHGANTLDDRVAAVEKLKQGIAQLPIVGQAAVGIAEAISEELNRGHAATQGQIAAQEKLNDATAKRLAILQGIKAESQKLIDAQKVEEQGLGKTAAEQRVIALREQLRLFDKEVADATKNTGHKPEKADEGRAAILRSVQNAEIEVERQNDAASRQRAEKAADEEADARIARVRSGGQAELAERLQLVETIKRKEREIQDRIDDAKRNGRTQDADNYQLELERQQATDRRQIAAFDEQQRYALRKAAIDKTREERAQDAAEESQLRQAQLRAAGRDYEADVRAFEDAWDAKILKIKESGDAEAVERAEQTREAERAARARQRDDERQSASSRARVAELRANHQEFRAQLEDVQERNRQLIEEAKKSGDPERIASAYKEARANVKQLQESMKQTPQYEQTSMRDVYTRLQQGVLNGQGALAEASRRDREGAQIGAKNEEERLKQEQADAAKAQGAAADKLGTAADKIINGPQVLVLS